MRGNNHHRRRTLIKIFVITLALLVAVRLALPYVVLHYANKNLATMNGYRGHIEDIDLALLRGAYNIDSIYINKHDSVNNVQTPFFGAKQIDLSIEWRSLLKGSVVGELVFDHPTLRFTKDKVEPKKVKQDSTDFKKLLEDLMPLKVNKFEVIGGRVQYIDESSTPRVDVTLSNAHIVALNLRNAYDSAESLLPASITANAEVYEGTLDFFMKLNPLADVPTFDMNAELKNTNLVKLNDFFQAYANVDINKGTFGLYTEVAAKDGYFNGYVKPLLHDMDVLGKEDRKDNIFRKLWEGLVGATGQIIENVKEDQVATKIPFKGDVQDPKANIWYTIVSVLENAFIRAIQPSLDHEISIGSVDNPKDDKKSTLEKIFGGKSDQEKEEKREERKERREEKKEEKQREEEQK